MFKQMTKPSKPLLITLGALLSVPLAISYTSYAIANKPIAEEKAEQQILPKVAIVNTQANSYTASVTAFGEVKPQFQITLVAEVSGKVTSITDDFAGGQPLQKGTVLAQIESTPYQQSLVLAKQALASAELKFLQEQREAKQAKEEWSLSGLNNQQASPLVLREPQLNAAKAELEQARIAVKQAALDLDKAQVKAPFHAVIVDRQVSPGQFVNTGDAIATVYSLNRVDIKLSLPQEQWQLLADRNQLLQQSQVLVSDKQGNHWTARVTEVDQHINSQSRQRALTVSVDAPLQQTPALLPGRFLQVSIQGKPQANLLAVPAKSLTNKGKVWYVDKANQLASFNANVVFQQDGLLYVSSPDSTGAVKVIKAPQTSWVEGQLVEPSVDTEVKS